MYLHFGMNKLSQVFVIIPLYNEEAILPELFTRLDSLITNSHEYISVLFIDDGSSDNTGQLISQHINGKKSYSALFLSRNFGHAAAITAGMSAMPASADAVLVLDGDLQDPPELLPRFIEKMNEGYDVVYGIRKNRKEGFLKKLSYKTYYRLIKRSSNIKMPLDAGDFSLMSKRVVEHLNQMPEESRYLRGMRSWVGYRQAGIAYDRQERKGGKSKYGWRALWKLAFNGLFNFSEFPIRFIGFVGLITILVSLSYLVVTIYKKLVFGTVPEGFTALIFAIVLFSGVQLLSIGILGEYILRIFFQVKQRPLYIIRSKIVNGQPGNE